MQPTIEQLKSKVKIVINFDSDDNYAELGQYIKYGFTQKTLDLYKFDIKSLIGSLADQCADRAQQILSAEPSTMFSTNGVCVLASDAKEDLLRILN